MAVDLGPKQLAANAEVLRQRKRSDIASDGARSHRRVPWKRNWSHQMRSPAVIQDKGQQEPLLGHEKNYRELSHSQLQGQTWRRHQHPGSQ